MPTGAWLQPGSRRARAPSAVTRHAAAPIAVLGVGGVGGLIAARTGALCVGTSRTVAAIRARGLTLVREGEATVTHPDAFERLDRPVRLLVIAVKAPSLSDALGRLEPSLLADAAVLPLLNGLEHVTMLRAWLGRERAPRPPVVLAGSIGRLEALSTAPGVVEQRTPLPLLTVASDTLPVRDLDAVLEPLRAPGLEVVVGASEAAVLWEKAARLSVLAAATVASELSVGALRADATWRMRLEVALAEACATATADGVPLDPAAQWAIIEAMPDALTTSAARDALAGRPTELDAITGSVVRAGRRMAVPTPQLERLLDEAEARCRPR